MSAGLGLDRDLGSRFGRLVRELRESRGWSQERLASRAKLNRSYMGEVERAAVMPSLATAAKLARALDVRLSDLIADCEPEADLNRRSVDGDSRLIRG